MTVRRRATASAVALGVPALAWVVLWWPVLSGDALLYDRDLLLLAAPLKSYVAERLLAGNLPLWTPMISAGMPLLGDPVNQVLYPGNLLFLLAPTAAHANTWFALLHSAGGALGCLLLLRALGLSVAGAGWGAALYAVSGYVVSISDNMNYLPAVTWVPLGLAAVLRAFDRASPGRGAWTLAGGACVAALLLAGDPFNSSVLAAVSVCLAFAGPAGGAERRSRLVLAGAVIGIGAALAAVQVVPAWQLLAWSERGGGLESAAALQWSFPPVRVLELVRPFPFGSYFPGFDYLADGRYPGRAGPWVNSVYLGLVPVALAALGLIADRRLWVWGLVGAGTLVAAFGGHLPGAEDLAAHVPWVRAQRYPEKFIYWTTLALVVLAARGSEIAWGRIARASAASGGSVLVRLAVALGLGAVIVGALSYAPSVMIPDERAWGPSLLWSRILGVPVTHVDAVLAHGLAASAVIGGWWVLGPRARRALLPIVLGASVLDAGWVHMRSLPTAPSAIAAPADPPRALTVLAAGPAPVRVYFDPRSPGFPVRFRAERLAAEVLAGLGPDLAHRRYEQGYLFHYRWRYMFDRLTTVVGIPFGVEYLNGEVSPVQPVHHLHWERAFADADRPGAAWLARAGVGWVLTGIEPANPQWDAPGTLEVHRDEELNLRVLRVLDAVPRHRLVSSRRGIDSRAPASAAVAQRGALVPSDLTELATVGGGAAPGKVEVLIGGPDEHELAIEAVGAGGYIVLTDSYFPGWTARVNGAPAAIHLADGRFMAVAVPPGRSVVTLEFRPLAVGVGAAVSLAAVVVSVAAIACGRRRSRCKSRAPARGPRSTAAGR